jgi:hypothetical protein
MLTLDLMQAQPLKPRRRSAISIGEASPREDAVEAGDRQVNVVQACTVAARSGPA